MGTHLIVLSENYPMNTNSTGFRCFSKMVSTDASWTGFTVILAMHRALQTLLLLFKLHMGIICNICSVPQSVYYQHMF